MNEREISFWSGAWEDGWGALPFLAVVCGAWAGGMTPLWQPTLAGMLALVAVGWLPLWRALEGTDWVTPLRAWRTWDAEAALPTWPYLQPDTPGAALHRRLRQALAWWRECAAATLALPLRVALFSLALSALLSLVIGRTALLLTLLFITLSEIALLWDDTGRSPAFFSALLQVGLPWWLGASSGTLTPALGLSGLALSVAVVSCLRPTRALALGWAPLLILLVGWQRPFSAGMVALSALPIVWLSLQMPEGLRRRAGGWMALVLVLTAGAWIWSG